MPIIYRNSKTGAQTKLPTVEEVAARYTDPEKGRVAGRRQRLLLERMDRSAKWHRTSPAEEPQRSPRGASRELPEALTAPYRPTHAEVRAWANEQGIEVSAVGRVPDAVVESYVKAREAVLAVEQSRGGTEGPEHRRSSARGVLRADGTVSG